MSEEPQVEVRRSGRRKRTLTVRREGDRLVALVPAHLTFRQEQELLPGLVERFLRREAKFSLVGGDDELRERALSLHATYLAPVVGDEIPGFRVNWVDNQRHRWGSCSTATGAIRLSSRLRLMPVWVIDAVLLHELVHLYEPNHSARFHRLLAAYPRLAEASAFLAGYQFAVDSGATQNWLDGDRDAASDD